MKTASTSVSSSKLVAVLAAGVLAASLSHAQTPKPSGASGQEMGSKEMHQSMMSGMKEMQQMQPSGDTDKDFATMMIKHHQQAIEMSKIEAEHGDSPEMKAIADKIAQDSKQDIERMQQWSKQQR